MKRGPNLVDFEMARRYPFLCFPPRERRILRWHGAANPPTRFSWPPWNAPNWSAGNARRPFRPGWPGARRSCCGVPMGWPSQPSPGASGWGDGWSARGCRAFSTNGFRASQINPAGVASRGFPPAVAGPRVKLAGERPEKLGRSLSPWDGVELARPLEREGLVEHMSPETGRRILAHHKLTPWRHHVW